MISSSVTWRRVTPRLAASAAAISSTIGSGNARAAARLVAIPPGAGLLPVAAQLVEPVRHFRLRTLRAGLAGQLQMLANAPADVDAGDVLHAERADRHPELGERVVDLRHGGALFEQQIRLAHVVRDHPVGDEPETVADHHADLAELLRQRQRGRDRLLARLFAADDLQQLHHVGRAEEVVADHLARTAAGLRELVDVQRRGVRGQDAGRLRDPRQLRERRLLQIHVLEHGFDDDVGLIEAVVGGGRRDERHRARHGVGGHAALRHGRFVILADGRHAALHRGIVHVLQQHGNAGVGVGHGNAAAHRARADHGRARDRHRPACPSARRAPSRLRDPRRTCGPARGIRWTSRSRRRARARAPSPRRSRA